MGSARFSLTIVEATHADGQASGRVVRSVTEDGRTTTTVRELVSQTPPPVADKPRRLARTKAKDRREKRP